MTAQRRYKALDADTQTDVDLLVGAAKRDKDLNRPQCDELREQLAGEDIHALKARLAAAFRIGSKDSGLGV